MFSFFRKKKPQPTAVEAPALSTQAPASAQAPHEAAQAPDAAVAPPPSAPAQAAPHSEAHAPVLTPSDAPVPEATPVQRAAQTQADRADQPAPAALAAPEPPAASAAPPDETTGAPAELAPPAEPAASAPKPAAPANPEKPARQSWLARLRQGLSKTGANISAVFVNAKVDDDLYDELEAALLSADVGVKATTHLLNQLRKDVRAQRAQTPEHVKTLLRQGIAGLLTPLQRSLVIGEHATTVLMVAGVNGAGKTTSIGKLTQHLSHHGASVLLAAADTFRAAAREQLSVWADRNRVEIISQAEADPAAVSFDAVRAGIARGRDVVIIDTAGRLPTQLHLMEELRKIKRVVTKAEASAPHEVLLVLDGNTGQNALAQVKAFDEALALTGLIVTKLDGTAKGGVLAAIAMERPIPVYFIGVGEQLQDLQTFDPAEFAQALLP